MAGSSARREGEVTERPSPPDGVLRSGYDLGGFYDEAFERDAGGAVVPRPHYAELIAQISAMAGSELRRAAELANRSFLHRGVTFTVYSDGRNDAAERILPFDPIPRILPAGEWAIVEAGLRQSTTCTTGRRSSGRGSCRAPSSCSLATSVERS
jgi:hypothetical protein